MKDDSLYLRHIVEAVDRVLSFGVSLQIVWDVVENHLGPLRAKVASLLSQD